MYEYDGKDHKYVLSKIEANTLDAPDCNEALEIERQVMINEIAIESAKKEFVQAYKDLKAFGLTKESIYSLINQPD